MLWVRLITAAVILGVIAVPVFLWVFQTYGVYRFGKSDQGPESLPISAVERVKLSAHDGTDIFVWVAQPKPDRPVIVSFHGNFTEIAPSFERLTPLVDAGLGLVMLEYRGSAQAPGRTNERRMKADAVAVYDALGRLIEGGIEGRTTISHGYSLGSSPGIWLATQRPVDGLLMESGYARLNEYWESRYRGIPIFRLMWAERNDNAAIIDQVSAPVLIVHGDKDPFVPKAWSREVFEKATAPKRYVLYPDGAHADLHEHGLLDDLASFAADPKAFAEDK